MICVSIGTPTESEMLRAIAAADEVADIVELRLDYLRNPKSADLKRLIRAGKKKKIVVVRPKREGGKFRGSEKARAELLRKAAKAGAAYLDIEFSAPAAFRNEIIKNLGKAKLIFSYHNFRETPGEAALKKLFDRMSAVRSADVIKIVTYAKRETDILPIIGLLRMAAKRNRATIAFCMGPKGRMSRLLALLDGSFLTYASLRAGKEIAQGQIPAKRMRAIYKSLGVRND